MKTIYTLRITGFVVIPGLYILVLCAFTNYNLGDASAVGTFVGFGSFALAILWSLLILFFGNKIYRGRKTKFDKVLFGLVAGPALTCAVIWMLSMVVFPILDSCVW